MAFLEKIISQTGATKIHLIAHSMGNVVLLDTLEKIKIKRDGGHEAGARFAEIIMHSPDVAKDRFREVMREISGLGSGATLYASTSDRAIWLSAWIWGERVDPSVFAGVETIDTTAAGSSFLGLNHDLYVTNPVIFNDMRSMLKQGMHPPDKRSPAFASTATLDGTFWLYRRESVAGQAADTSPFAATRNSNAEDARAISVAAPVANVDLNRDETMRHQAEIRQAREEAEALKRSSEELRQLLGEAQGAKSAAEEALEALRSAVSSAQRDASEAHQRLELERLAREKAESDAVAARSELARERALVAERLKEDAKNETAAIAEPKGENLQAVETPPAQSNDKADAKRTRNANAKAARKRRAAKDAAQNWPFSAW
jgi:hypothetical protein